MLELERHETHSALSVKLCMAKINHGAADMIFGTRADALQGSAFWNHVSRPGSYSGREGQLQRLWNCFLTCLLLT